MRKVELASWKDVPRRLASLRKTLEIIYEVKLGVAFEDVPIDRLHSTESFLEKDKLAVVFMKVLTEDYDVPIIAVKRVEDFFVLDGHHRSFISKKLMKKTVKAYVLNFPKNKSYRAVAKRSLEDLPIKDVGVIDDPLMKTWGQILTILKYYEALYDISFYLRKEQVHLEDLVPTQSQIRKERVDSIKELLVPIACVKHEGRFYILDGHARSLRAKELGLESVQTMILSPEAKIDFGIVKAVKEMNIRSLEDIQVME
jgi:ParB-like chromosome segregation protein Spo0J